MKTKSISKKNRKNTAFLTSSPITRVGFIILGGNFSENEPITKYEYPSNSTGEAIMTLPRLIIPNTTYMITRSTFQRRHFFKVDKKVEETFGYYFSLAANKYNISVHSLTLMSDHYHAVVTDNEGNLPAFTAWFHRTFAVWLKSYLKWDELIFAPDEKPNYVALLTKEAVWKKLSYVRHNPVKAGLVRHAKDYPGLCTGADTQYLQASRPEGMGKWSKLLKEEVSIQLTVPPLLSEYSFEEYSEILEEMYKEDEKQIIKEVLEEAKKKRKKRAFMGTRRLLNTSPFQRSKKRKGKRRLIPRFAAITQQGLLKAKIMFRSFYETYFKALKRFQEGDKEVEFPYGTYKMRVQYQCYCDM